MWTWTMRVDLGLLLLLLALCGSGAQGEDGGLEEEWTKQNTEQTAPDIWAEVRALRDMVVRLDVLMEMLQRENTVLAADLTSLETRLTATERRTSDLEKENAALQTRLSSSESELVVSKSRIDQLERENAELQTRLSSSESEILITKSRIDQLERENAEKPKVAFYAALTDAGSVGPYNTDIILRYNKVFTNIGDAYSPSTGFFTAPVKGVYYFQFTVCGYQANNVGVQVFKNNQLIMHNAEWNDNGHHRYITNSVILELMAGDEIHVVLPSGHSLLDDVNNHSTFSGALLFPL